MSKLRIEKFIKPKKVLEFTIPESGETIKLHVEGISASEYGMLEAFRLQYMYSTENVDPSEITKEYFKKMVCKMVKKVEGVVIVDENGEETEWECSFTDYSKTTLTDESYEFICLILLQNDYISPIQDAYHESVKFKKAGAIESVKKNEVQSE